MKIKKNKNKFIRRQLNRMQDFEYEFSAYDVKDFNREDRKLLQSYGLGELNFCFIEYYNTRSK